MISRLQGKRSGRSKEEEKEEEEELPVAMMRAL